MARRLHNCSLALVLLVAGICSAAAIPPTTVRLELNANTLQTALDGFLKAVGQAYNFTGLIDIPDDRLFLANVSPQLFKAPFNLESLKNGNSFKQFQQLNLTETLRSLSNPDLIQELTKQLEGQSITGSLQGLSNGDVLEQLAKQFAQGEGLNLTERIATAARQTASQLNSKLAKASKSATQRLQDLQTQPGSATSFQPCLQNIFSKFLGSCSPAASNPTITTTTAAAAGRRLQSDNESESESPEEAAEKISHLNSIRASLRELTKLARAQAHLEQSEFGLLNGTSDGAATRKLKQKSAGSQGGIDRNAYSVIFSNLFDFFFDPEDDGDADSLFFLRQFVNGGVGTLEKYNWIGDLANILDAPFDNLVNTNWFPLPQTTDEAESLLRRFLDEFCTEEKAESSELVLFEFQGPTLAVNLNPVYCPVTKDKETGRNFINFENCTAATLEIATTPLTITEPYLTASSYKGAECKYQESFGIDTSVVLAGGAQSFTFRRSTQGVDLVPLITTFDIRILNQRVSKTPGGK